MRNMNRKTSKDVFFGFTNTNEKWYHNSSYFCIWMKVIAYRIWGNRYSIQ